MYTKQDAGLVLWTMTAMLKELKSQENILSYLIGRKKETANNGPVRWKNQRGIRVSLDMGIKHSKREIQNLKQQIEQLKKVTR